ncbi:MAG: Uma2 family endonuclease [Thermanaeromonas sp.]|uniref:Uma2 family endonuclease n=1 Tax=Thermanaeromonas sp. TaxID=2003697 RepID=UPI0024406895|nr:Uma2 family endonuclease [Thermanaeromonas sp.]MCG0277868.1 Uma2 family endonuclease [Thermanaeromonas sp.]
MAITKRYTYRDYLELGDENRYEVIEGELHLIPSPSFKHQSVVRKLAGLLAEWVEKRNLGVVITAPEGWRLAGAYGKEDVALSPLLPGLEIDLNTIFAYPPGLEI